MQKYIKKRHKFYFRFLRPVGALMAAKYHFKTKPMKLKKGENYLIVANHQTLLDPVFLAYSFKAPVYLMASDSLFTNKWYSKLLVHCFAPVKKRKGVVDISCIRSACQIAKEGGNVAFFPEGNRAWNDFQMHIDMATCKMVRLLKLPLIIYNFEGGYGVDPRWSGKLRKGKFVGRVKKILSVEEMSAMTDDQLLEEIRKNLRVIDSESGNLYKSKRRAEFLERQLFVCPKCGKIQTLLSHGNNVECTNCGLTVCYEKNLHLTSADPSFAFDKVVDWYKFQQEYVKNFEIVPNQIIFTDKNVTVFDKTTQNRVQLEKGTLTMDNEKLQVGSWCVPLSDVTNSSVVGGTKLYLNTKDKCFYLVGDERFNPIKYLLFFNRLCERIVETGGDKYYGLSIDAGCE